MLDKMFRRYRFIEVFKADTPEELKALLAKINIPCKLKSMYQDVKTGEHIAWVNLERPLKRLEIVKKSSRNTDKEYKES
jgi:hypothetical protein